MSVVALVIAPSIAISADTLTAYNESKQQEQVNTIMVDSQAYSQTGDTAKTSIHIQIEEKEQISAETSDVDTKSEAHKPGDLR